MAEVSPRTSTSELELEAVGASSPLWMVSRAPQLNALVGSLQEHRRALDEGRGGERLLFSRTDIEIGRASCRERVS
jgi:hypothetical protein